MAQLERLARTLAMKIDNSIRKNGSSYNGISLYPLTEQQYLKLYLNEFSVTFPHLKLERIRE